MVSTRQPVFQEIQILEVAAASFPLRNTGA
jgi:hypothetical protein